MKSKEMGDVYAKREPGEAFHERIRACLSLHDDSVKVRFSRRRPDIAAYVFGRMRAAANPAQWPTPDAYVRVFEGRGRCPDSESPRMVHNMLKTEAVVAQPDTRPWNAQMIAHLGTESPRRGNIASPTLGARFFLAIL